MKTSNNRNTHPTLFDILTSRARLTSLARQPIPASTQGASNSIQKALGRLSSSDDESTPAEKADQQKDLKLVNFSKITPDPNTYIEGTQIKVQSVACATFSDGRVRTYVKAEGGFPLVPLGSATLVTRKEETECK